MLEAGLLTSSIDSLMATERIEDAARNGERAREIHRELGFRLSEAIDTSNLGNALRALGRAEEALREHERALATAEEVGDPHHTGRFAGCLGQDLLVLGRFEKAVRELSRSTEIAREIGDVVGDRIFSAGLGLALLAAGRLEEAEEALDHSLSPVEGQEPVSAVYHRFLGTVYSAMGRHAEAEESIRQCLEFHRESVDREREGVALYHLGNAAAAASDMEEAIVRFRQAHDLLRESSDAAWTCRALAALGGALQSEGEESEAAPLLFEARDLAVEVDCPEQLVVASGLLSLIEPGDVDAAVATFEQHEERLPVIVRLEARFTLWKATSDTAHLEEAHRLLCEFRDHAPEEYRETMIANVALHRGIMAAWEERGG
jgi:tetratricopeptide (TPR) repeat protein